MEITEEIMLNRKKTAFQMAQAVMENKHRQWAFFSIREDTELSAGVSGEEIVFMMEGSCQSAACLAGHTWLACDGVLTCPEPLKEEFSKFQGHGTQFSVFWFAMHALGLTVEQAKWVFLQMADDTDDPEVRGFVAWLGENPGATTEAIDQRLGIS
jgi:hypothetical protein